MKRIESTIGYRVIDNEGFVTYHTDFTKNGYVYKDDDAFESGNGICYIPENGFYAGVATEEDGYTKEDIFDLINEYSEKEYSDDELKDVAKALYYDMDWANPMTYIECFPELL